MYCSSCGSAVPQNLSFCNRCGAQINGVPRPAELTPDSLVWAIASIFIVGLGAIIGLMALMKEDNGGVNPIILVAAMLSFMLMLVIEGVLMWLLVSRGRRAKKEAGDAGRLKEQTTKELAEAQARALPEPASSVTEHTTRAFEPSYSERKSK
jgi:hypothetical protein